MQTNRRFPLSRLELQQLKARGTEAIDLSVTGGECVCLSGPSGAGKTVLLRAVADLDPHQGTVALDDAPINTFKPAEWRQRVGLLPAESQWWHDRVGEHFCRIEAERWQRLGFDTQTADWAVAHLSTGERQWLALLRLLANRPAALLLDEPTAALDPENVVRAETLIGEYRREQQVPVLWVSHDPAQIRRVADRHFHIEGGRLREVPL